MRKFNLSKLSVFLVAIFALVLAACSNSDNKPADSNTVSPANATPAATTSAAANSSAAATVEITDAHGTVTVPVNPAKVVALDNRTFETLSDWGVKLAAAPKGVMPPDSPYVSDDTVQDIGDHREPNLEILASVEPELVIVGQRFAGYYEDIKKLVPNAAVIDLNFDVSTEAASPGDNLVNGFKQTTTDLGEIFGKQEEAGKLNADFDKAIADAKAAYNGTDKIMSVVVSGGTIGFSAPHSGRVWGPLYEILGWVPALEVEKSSSDHQGDDISVEAIAQSNPDWIFVLDRDAAISSDEASVPAQDVIDNAPALKNTTAITKGQIVYAPNDTYTNESIETFIEIFNNLSEALAKAKQ
ncbi:siderophore ABC transporter substrate-binding protein [Paenibacillus sp. MMS20-IR301]|uniref:siderophore ABC transporter substrate-binding protein n=1 Tax=Paenibacillus sp. MMS20-IR301 TaxID=2895946 RepID=UPI0028E62D53|nr:siderophore ABC transporter substrate-binding protein [Paenibacillus sp. MMS20-IR301]WNS41350.1 siderophore ABC transporter substrate-binding protein [Paenibacillus sp. MMS20-IR301]